MQQFIRQTLSVVLTLCMVLTLSASWVYAEPEVQEEVTVTAEDAESSETQENVSEEPELSSDIKEAEAEQPVSDPSDSEEISAVSEETEKSSVMETEAADQKEAAETTDTETEETSDEDEDAFEETGSLDFTVTDRNGTEIRPWYDSSSDIYYLFLTNAVTISDVELQIKGIKISKTSRGELDQKTNTVKGAFSRSGDGITLTGGNGTKYNVMVKQSGIPSLSITLNGTSLEKIHSGSKSKKYPGQSIVLTDASGNVNLSQKDVELKGRGNSSWSNSDKKPYQIKFSKKQSVLGMEKAKKWVLLANTFDESLIRNQIAYYLGDTLGMTFTPDMVPVELWIDGEYRGAYTIGEKVEIDKNRLNLSDPLGALMEYDNAFYNQEDYWYEDSVLSAHFTLKESVDEDNPQGAMKNFQSKTAAFGNYLFNTAPSSITLEGLGRYIDVDSFAKWFLINEYLSNAESYTTSWFWYCDGPSDVLHLGPLWDYDTSQGISGSYSSPTMMYGQQHHRIIRTLMQSPAFANYVKKLYTQYRSTFSSLPGTAAVFGSQTAPAADCNYTRWQMLGKGTIKREAKVFEPTYSKALDYLKNWLAARDTGFAVNVPSVPTANTSVSVSAGGRTLTVKATEVTGTSSIRAAVWSQTNGQDDLKWYDLTKNADGTFSKKISLADHGSSDTYYIHLYSGKTFLGAHTEKVTMAAPEVSAEYNAGTGVIHVTVKHAEEFKTLQTAVWSAVNSQDDLKWINTKTGGKGTVSQDIDASFLKHNGKVFVHVYGTGSSKQKFAGSAVVEINDPGKPVITAVQTDGGNVLDITAEQMPGWSEVIAAVWGRTNDQNDLKWYDMTRNSDGSWSSSVDLSVHKETGVFYVHVYGKKSGKRILAGTTELTVTESAAPAVTVKTLEEGVKLQAVLKNAPSLDKVSIAVWGAKDSQNDLKWYTAKKQANGSWTVDVPLENHQETGTYQFHAYGTKNGKQTFQAAASAEVEKLNCSFLNCSLSSSEKSLSVSLENASSFKDARFAVWGEKNGQNDLKWYTAKRNLDGSYSCLIPLSDHKETGLYRIHAYGTKNGKSTFAGAASVTVKAFAKTEVTASAKGKTFQAKAANADDCTEVRFAVWTEANGQDDLKWYKAAKYSDGSYRLSIPTLAAHGGNGLYKIHAYGTKNGKETLLGTCTFEKTDFAQPEVKAEMNSDGKKLIVTVKDSIGYTNINAAVWGAKDGQNDLKWYTLKQKDAGVYEISVDPAKHNEKGIYNIHVYGNVSGGKQFFMGADTVTVP